MLYKKNNKIIVKNNPKQKNFFLTGSLVADANFVFDDDDDNDVCCIEDVLILSGVMAISVVVGITGTEEGWGRIGIRLLFSSFIRIWFVDGICIDAFRAENNGDNDSPLARRKKKSIFFSKNYSSYHLLFDVNNCVSKTLVLGVIRDGSLTADINGGRLIGSRVFDLDRCRPRGAPRSFGSGLISSFYAKIYNNKTFFIEKILTFEKKKHLKQHTKIKTKLTTTELTICWYWECAAACIVGWICIILCTDICCCCGCCDEENFKLGITGAENL